ncbi:MAG: L-lactate dehydrogenase [bacterium]
MKCKNCVGSGNVAIIGAGNVGSTAAFTIMLDGIANKITLIDINKQKADGEKLDLCHGMQFTKKLIEIEAGDSFELVCDAEVIVICAGVAQKKGEKRTDILEKNVKVFKQIIPEIKKYNQEAILLVITNPVDILTYITYKLSGFDKYRVFSSGTVLDTARLRFLLGKHFKVSPKDISAYVLGEHGDTEFVWWSKAEIGGVSLEKFNGYSKKVLDEIYLRVKNSAEEIISKKGMTNYAIGLVISKIVRSILLDQSRVFTVSTVLNDYLGADEVCLSIPTIVRRGGIYRQLAIDLNPDEKEQFKLGSDKIKQFINLAEKFLD